MAKHVLLVVLLCAVATVGWTQAFWEDFNDNDITHWTVGSGTWVATSGELNQTQSHGGFPGGTFGIAHSHSVIAPDRHYTFDMWTQTTAAPGATEQWGGMALFGPCDGSEGGLIVALRNNAGAEGLNLLIGGVAWVVGSANYDWDIQTWYRIKVKVVITGPNSADVSAKIWKRDSEVEPCDWLWTASASNGAIDTFGTCIDLYTHGMIAGEDVMKFDNVGLWPIVSVEVKPVTGVDDGNSPFKTIAAAITALAGDSITATNEIKLVPEQYTPFVETSRLIFTAEQSSSVTLAQLTVYNDNLSTQAIIAGAKLDESFRTNSPGGTTVIFKDIYFIPQYEADGLIGTGASSNFDGFEAYRSAGTGLTTDIFCNCVFTGSVSGNYPSDPYDPLPGTADATICSWGDDWHFFHSNVYSIFRNCIIAHANDDAILNYGPVLFTDGSKIINNGGLGVQDLTDNGETSRWIGTAGNRIEIAYNGNRYAQQGYAFWGGGAGVNTRTSYIAYCDIHDNDMEGVYIGDFTTEDDLLTINMDHVDVYNNGDDGVWFNHNSADLNMTNCDVSNNGVDGVQIWRGNNISIDLSDMTLNQGVGLFCDLYGGLCNILLTNSNVTTNTQDGATQYGIYYWWGTGTLKMDNDLVAGHGNGTDGTGLYLESLDEANSYIKNCKFYKNDYGIFNNRADPLNLENCCFYGNTAAAVRIDGGVTASLGTVDGCCFDSNPQGIGMYSQYAALPAATVENCTFINCSTAGIQSGDTGGASDNYQDVNVKDSIFAGPGYAFGNKNSIDQGEDIIVTYSALVQAGPNALTAVMNPTYPNRGANDPFDYSAGSVITADPMFVTINRADPANYLDVANSFYGNKNSVGGPLSGCADYVGAPTAVGDWFLY